MTGKIHWRCFHCDAAFTLAQRRWAREHFGADEGEVPVCLVRSAGEGALLTALRNAQDELSSYRAEDTDLMRAMYSMQADHAQRLIREEEHGYAKGLTDGRELLAAAKEALRFYRDHWSFTAVGDEGDGVTDFGRLDGYEAHPLNSLKIDGGDKAREFLRLVDGDAIAATKLVEVV